ncbi:hypothetical protein FB45DRAFT_907793 [Roridomyces roridus]|uniref:Secreted protein n=1 Tax=Roridomyces roridus TaxID=1738132 RepID=A0AAD7C227_9AGAR|nr:hypothetical protein FB45DRAFT_907793 [Roridomyces roridus]
MRFYPLVLTFVPLAVLADHNVTIDDTDPVIQYTGSGGHSTPCELSSSGQILSQPGCFSNGPQNCTSGAHILQEQTGTLSMQFKGSAIYMNALLDGISNTYTVTLDGVATDVDGVRNTAGGALLCYTLFAQTNLDATVEHNISLSIKGLSPDRNTTLGNDNTFFFWLDNFIVTTPDEDTSSSPNGSASGSTSATGSSPASPSATTGSSGAVGGFVAILPSILVGIASAWLLVHL